MSFPSYNMVIFHSYVNVYQVVNIPWILDGFQASQIGGAGFRWPIHSFWWANSRKVIEDVGKHVGNSWKFYIKLGVFWGTLI